ncbi:MAG: shikimate kinase [Ferruginibacter sp.]|nr:shikimate kinase [Ferruginibacter sp.]
MNFYLIGFMGSGKSYLGSIWAKQNNFTFCDLDTLIEKEENDNIANIFSTNGENYFREKETKILKKTLKFENTIIACGGGAPCFFDNIKWMNENGTTIFLNEGLGHIYYRLAKEKSKRPLIANLTNDELMQFVKEKTKEREPYYTQSKIILTHEHLNENGFSEILKSIK